MKQLKNLLLLFILLTIAAGADAQQKLSEGKVTFEIAYGDTDLPDETMAMMPTEMDMYFKNDKSRVEMSMGMGMNQTMIFDNKARTMTMLMDMMGNKIAVKNTEEDIKKQKEKNGKKDNKIEFTNETKQIAGYTCKKAKVTNDEGSFDLYYTDDIVIKDGDWNSDFKDIKGFPMQYQMNQGKMQMTMTAKKVTAQAVEDKMFTVPADYKEKTPEELQKMFGGGQ